MRVANVDVAVIGAGTAGLNARRQAEKAGAETVLIEAGPYGTTCARVGCMPSKLLIAAAEAAHGVARADVFGIEVGPPRVNGKAVLERVRRERDRFVDFVLETVEEIPESRRLRGPARFVAPTTLEVDGETRVEARAVVIATGSTPQHPSYLAEHADQVLTNESVFELDGLPESVAVIGSGVVGLELGQALARLGVRTAIFGRSARVGPATDPEIQRATREGLGEELELHLDVELDVAREAGGWRVAWRGEGEPGSARFERVLSAAGRAPALAALDLERANLELDARGVPLHDPRTLQCGEQPIFIAGDANDDRPLLHEAADEGRIAGSNAAAWPEVRARARRTPLAIVFTDPEIALVGERFADLDRDEIEIGEVDYEDQGRARVLGRNLGRVRVYGRRECGTLLGAEMFGPRVEHTAHLLAWAVEQSLTVEEALACPVYHPVIEEGIQTALRDLSAKLALRAPIPEHDMECGPGS